MFAIDDNIYKSIDDILDDSISFIKNNRKIQYANVPCTIDIETSSFYENGEKRGIMYAFVIGINGKTYIGRTYNELWDSMDKISEFYALSEERRMIFFVHNLSFEFQWFRKWRKWIKVFSTEERNPLYALDEKGIELRCSYQLSGYSLENVGKNLTRYKVNKMVGDLDYKLIRHSKTPLTNKELKYIQNDGLVVMAYIQEEIENHHNNITLLPLTKTGKVRTYVRKKCLYSGKHSKNQYKFIKYHNMMKALPICSVDEYEQLKRAFSGGFTHANGYYVNQTINNVYSFDFTSSYPYVMVSEQFPMGKGELIQITNTEQFRKNLTKYCCMFDVIFINIDSKILYEHPISTSKCWKKINFASDNGRLVCADEIGITITEQDFEIIRRFYSWKKMRIKNFRRYRKNYLPHDFVSAVLDLYQKKTELKGVEESVVEYNNSKEMLNSCYGMCVTDIIREEIDYTNDTWGKIPPTPEEDLKKYNERKNRFLCYQWGVWNTAYARRNLFSAIYNLGDDYLYSDTDSVKFINLERHKNYFKKYNEIVVNKLQRAMDFHGFDYNRVQPLTIKGEKKIIGQWDYDGFYKKFRTLGAKRYMVLTDKGYSLTVSGVNKKYAIPYLYKMYGDSIMEHFTDGLIVPPQYTGKNIHTYIDEETTGNVTDYNGVVCDYYEKSSIHLEESGYELSLSRDFIDYLMGIKLSI